MILIIDAYNILKNLCCGEHVTPKERIAFIGRLGRYGKIKGHKVIAVFDGGPDDKSSRERIAGVSVVYSGTQESADDYIKQYIEKHHQFDILLVSSDRDIVMWAERHDIISIDSGEFYRLVKQALSKKEDARDHADDHVVKTSIDSTAELDMLMQEASVYVERKGEDLYGDVRQSDHHRLSKDEKKLLKKVKKL